jgi:catechol 1,2-dioxygenase
MKLTRRTFFFMGLATLPAIRGVSKAADCQATTGNDLGPFYRAGAPWRTRLCGVNEPGDPLVMSGRVTAAATCRPLEGVVVDVWQASAAGHYDISAPELSPSRRSFLFRGRMKTDGGGFYKFETVLPGRELSTPTSNRYRPRHIHYVVRREGYEPLITQCYFAGDEWLKLDPIVKPSLIISPESTQPSAGTRGALQGVFDIALAPERPANRQARKFYDEYAGEYQMTRGRVASVTAERGRLYLKIKFGAYDRPKYEMFPLTETRFYIREYDWDVAFVRDEGGRVAALLSGGDELLKKIK